VVSIDMGSWGARFRGLAFARRPGRDTATSISLTFDDGSATNVTAASLLAEHGMRGTFYVNTSTVDTEGHVSWANLDAMAAQGHEIGGHALEHVDLTRVGTAEARRQVGDDRATLTARGFAALSFAYPFGEFNAAVERIVRDCGYLSGRGAFGLRNITAPDDRRRYALPIPPRNPFAIPTPCCIRADTPLAALQSYIVHAEREGGGWVPITLHRVCDDCHGDPATSLRLATFAGLLAWLEPRASRGTVVRTVADVIVPHALRKRRFRLTREAALRLLPSPR
jgi:peptidoglycan/xylan/chitin deacetylase (PgdA/CDA1 family)